MMSFYDEVKSTLDNLNISVTENGAIGYKTTKSALLDLNFLVSSMRNMSDEGIVEKFSKAYEEDPIASLKWLFFLRDAREGLGERRSFRVIYKWLLENNIESALSLLAGNVDGESLIPFYGRWDDIVSLYEKNPQAVTDAIGKQLVKDLKNLESGKPVSLLAKWLPSINTSSSDTVKLAHKVAKSLGFKPSEYRKALSRLRKHIDVVEVKMSGNDWNSIDYEKVPSKANLNYSDAFMKHDSERRTKYLSDLASGKAKINASILYPYEIYHKVKSAVFGFGYYHSYENNSVDTSTYEAMWKEFVKNNKIDKEIIVVADGSGSMSSQVGGTSVTCLDVANSLALYFAEQLSGDFHNKYITFSENPQLVDLTNCNTLVDKIREAQNHNEVANTNIEAVFDLILNTAVRSGSKIPDSILIISDMEFDSCACTNEGLYAQDPQLFKQIEMRYKNHGFELPRLIFWNVCSRTYTIPLTENKNGVALLSGFSTNNAKMVISGELDPYKCLMETLNSERYQPLDRYIK